MEVVQTHIFNLVFLTDKKINRLISSFINHKKLFWCIGVVKKKKKSTFTFTSAKKVKVVDNRHHCY